MKTVALEDGAIDVIGALDMDRTPTGWVPRRLPAWTRTQIPDILMEVVVQMPSGVRMRFATDATTVELDVMLTHLRIVPNPLRASIFDLLVDGELTRQVPTTVGNLFTVGPGPADLNYDDGESTTVVFDDLGAGSKVIEIWLPQAAVVELRQIRVNDGAQVAAAPAPVAPRWIHYGSSISHCLEVDSPTGTWPAIAARDAGVELLSLGFGGQCMLDQFVARTIRDLPADAISLKVGINVVNGDTLRDRTFGSALHGFVDTVREGHPHTPILLVSPIYCPSAEDRPGPTVMGPEGRYITVAGLEELRLTCLTLTKIRSTIASLVEVRRGLGDHNLHYLDGLRLFGAEDAGDLPDGLHPNPAGYARLGHRFAELAFGHGGAFAPSA